MDKKNLIEALMQVLNDEDAAKAMVDTSRAVNQTIEDTDMMRRAATQGTAQGAYKEGRVSDGEYFVATDKFVAGVAGNIIASEAWQTVQRQIADLQKEVARLPIIERDNALLRARLGELEREDDEKISQKLNDRPQNRVRYIDLPDNAIVPNQARAIVSQDAPRFEEVQAMSQLDSLISRMEKVSRGGK